MSGGQPSSAVTIRQDLREMLDEYDFQKYQRLSAEIILPTISVAEAAARYPVLPRENRLRIPSTDRADNGTYPRDQWEWSDDSYTTQEYGFEEPIDLSRQARNSSFVDEEEISAQMAAQKLMLAREKRVADSVFNTTTFTGAANLETLTHEWDDPANAVPWANIEAAYAKLRAKCGLPKASCSLILTEDNIKYALKCTEIINSIIYTEAIPTMSEARKYQFLADYFGVKSIVPVASLYETTKPGNATPAMGHLWSSEYGMLAVLNSGGGSWREPGLGRQPAFNKITDTFLIEEYPEAQTRSLIIRALEYRGKKVFTDYGVLIDNMKTTVSNGL